MLNKKINITVSVVTLFLGATIYLLFRENTYISNFVEKYIELTIIRNSFKFLNLSFFKYYLVDYLWALSLITGLNTLFTTKKETLLICSFVFSLGSIWEILQFMNVVSGTGDTADIFMYLAAVVTAVIINFSN